MSYKWIFAMIQINILKAGLLLFGPTLLVYLISTNKAIGKANIWNWMIQAKKIWLERNIIKGNLRFEIDFTISVDSSLESIKKIEVQVQQLHQNLTGIANGKFNLIYK